MGRANHHVRWIAAAAILLLALNAHAVAEQSIVLSGDAHALAGATVAFTDLKGDDVDVRVQPPTDGGDLELLLELPDGVLSSAGTLTLHTSDGSDKTFDVPNARPNQRIRIDVRTKAAILETIARVAMLESSSPSITFTPPPPFTGPIVPWGSDTMSEEDRLAIEKRLRLTNEQAEAQAIRQSAAEVERQDAVARAAAPQRAAVDDKVDAYVRANKPAGADNVFVAGSIGEDGLYQRIVVRVSSSMTEYEATFDGRGNVLTPFTQTPIGKAEQNTLAHKPAHVHGVIRARFSRDTDGNQFISRIDYPNGGGYIQFNERGIAYRGEFFDANGTRTGAFEDASEFPKYGDPLGLLAPVDLQPLAMTTCLQCQSAVDGYNGVADDMNRIAREMNGLSDQHRLGDELANRFQLYHQELPPLRARYEHLATIWQEMSVELERQRDELFACSRRCDAASQPQYACGGDCDGPNPFSEPLAGLDATAGQPAYVASGEFDDQLCPYLSQPAETIACSVHTFERLPTCQDASPADDWRYGQCVPADDGGTDAEVFIRNPADNNLRQGCGDLTPALLFSNLDPYFKGIDIEVKPVACNRFAQSAPSASGIIRGQRDQLYVDTSDRRRFDHDREQRRKQARMGPSNQHLVVGNAISDAVATGIGTPCNRPRTQTDASVTHQDPKFSELPDKVKKLVGSGTQLTQADNVTTALEGAIGVAEAGNEFMQSTGTTVRRVNQLTHAASAGYQIADATVRVMSHEGLTLADAKQAIEHAAAISGNEQLETLGSGFGVLQKLREIKHKQDNGLPIETSDVKELADALQEVRGERFPGLGHVLDGISGGAQKISKGEEIVTDLITVWDMIKPGAEAPQDPVKAMEAFADYLEILSKLAGYVPGMGEFVTMYATAARSMQANVEAIAAAAERRNRAIATIWKEAIEGPNYQLLMQDAQQFEEELAEPPSGGQQLSADQINLQQATADEQAAVSNAEDDVNSAADCVQRLTLELYELGLNYEAMRERYASLPSVDQLETRMTQAAEATVLYPRAAASSNWLPDASQTARLGAASPQAAADSLRRFKSQTDANQALNRARADLSFKSAARERAAEMRAEYRQLKAQLEDCYRHLLRAQQRFWQAMRDFVAAYAYFHTLATAHGDVGLAGANQRAALANVDRQIAEAGFQLDGTRVVVVAVAGCDEEATVLMVGH